MLLAMWLLLPPHLSLPNKLLWEEKRKEKTFRCPLLIAHYFETSLYEQSMLSFNRNVCDFSSMYEHIPVLGSAAPF